MQVGPGTGWETWYVGSNPTPVYFESNWYWYTKFSLPEPWPLLPVEVKMFLY